MKQTKTEQQKQEPKPYQKPEIKSTLPAKEIRDIEQPCAFYLPGEPR